MGVHTLLQIPLADNMDNWPAPKRETLAAHSLVVAVQDLRDRDAPALAGEDQAA